MQKIGMSSCAASIASCLLAIGGTAPAHALGGKASAEADAAMRSQVVMVLGSRGSACTGTLISQDVVLTAGHCVQGSKQMAVAWIESGKPVLKAVAETATHPQFSGFNQRSIDLALVRLAKPMDGTFRPVSLEDSNNEHSSFELAGFGLQTSYDEASAGRLRHAQTVALPLSTSRVLHLGRESVPSELQICKGDSGGPVLAMASSGPVLAGVIVATYNSNVKPGARWSAICGNTAQAIRVGPQRAWIESVMQRWR